MRNETEDLRKLARQEEGAGAVEKDLLSAVPEGAKVRTTPKPDPDDLSAVPEDQRCEPYAHRTAGCGPTTRHLAPKTVAAFSRA